MNINFMFHNIKDMTLIYSNEEKYDEEWCDNIPERNYLGTDYCKNIIMQLKLHFSNIKNYKYNGQTDRMAHEDYDIETMLKQYSLSFTIDTFRDKEQARLSVSLSSQTHSEEYDIFLEKLKIFLKDILLKDWDVCTWIIDEQSEQLGMNLYPLIFKTENKMRAFINKILTHKFGANWVNLIGFENIINNYNKNKADLKRTVPEFRNINDFLICSTIESLAKLMLKSKIFEKTFSFSDADNIYLHKNLADNEPNKVFEILKKSRNIRVNTWDDIFKKYFDDNIEKAISNFIKNRNHVAHNKLLTFASADKMKNNIEMLDNMLEKADENFLNDEPSDELCETWQAEQEELWNEEKWIHDSIKNETGIEILSEDGIYDLFEEELIKIYDAIDDSEYFNYSIEIGEFQGLECDSTIQHLFSIKSNIDEKFSINVYVLLEVIENMGENSTMKLWVENDNETHVIETDITYHNGEAHYDNLEGYYIPDSESWLDKEAIKSFTDDLKNYLNEDMNPIKKEADTRSFVAIKDGSEPPVAPFPCWNCNQNYISINDSLYPYGKCINCGEENEISKCDRCGDIYSADDGGTYGEINLCNYCLEKIEND